MKFNAASLNLQFEVALMLIVVAVIAAEGKGSIQPCGITDRTILQASFTPGTKPSIAVIFLGNTYNLDVCQNVACYVCPV